MLKKVPHLPEKVGTRSQCTSCEVRQAGLDIRQYHKNNKKFINNVLTNVY